MAVEPSQVITRELEPGETLLWCGQPRNGVVFRASDALLIPFSIMWGGFAIFWETSVIREAYKNQSKIPLFFTLWGIPFVLVGLYLMFGRFLLDALQRENTYYGLTDRRVIIVVGLFERQRTLDLTIAIALITGLARHKVKTLDLRTMTDVSLTERGNGTGTITFGQNPYPFFARSSWPGSGSSFTSPSFDQIQNARLVYEHIRTAQRNAS